MNDRFAVSVCASVTPRLVAVLGLKSQRGTDDRLPNTHSAAAGGFAVCGSARHRDPRHFPATCRRIWRRSAGTGRRVRDGDGRRFPDAFSTELPDGAHSPRASCSSPSIPPVSSATQFREAQLAETRAALDLAATQLKMYASITDERAVSALDLETKRNTVAVDEAQVQAAHALENAQLNLDYCYIHFAIDGRAGARLVDVGCRAGNTEPRCC